MKWAMIGVAGLLVISLSVYAVGAMLPKAHRVSRSALYQVPPEPLFALIAGPQDWRPDVTRYEVVPDPSARHLVKETTRDGSVITYEIQQSTPPTYLKRRIVTENLPFSGRWEYSLDRDGDATRVRIPEDGEAYNPIFRFISSLLVGHHRTIDGYLNALAKSTNENVQI